jgi:hypothetical protein
VGRLSHYWGVVSEVARSQTGQTQPCIENRGKGGRFMQIALRHLVAGLEERRSSGRACRAAETTCTCHMARGSV